MKKILLILSTIIISTLMVNAEINPIYRYFELGVKANANVSENMFAVTDILQKYAVIDLTKIAETKKDLLVSSDADADIYLDMNFGKKFGMGLFFNVDASVRLGIGHQLIDFLAYGNDVGEVINIPVKAGAEVYLETGFSIKKQINRFIVKVSPSVFVPIVYMPQPKAYLQAENTSDGVMKYNAIMDFDMYSCVNMTAFEDINNFGKGFQVTDLMSIYKGIGFDISAEVEYPLFRTFDLGAYTRIPVVPGKLYHALSGTATTSGEASGFLDVLNGNKLATQINKPEFSGLKARDEEFTVNRPLRIGAQGAWRPFGKWCTFLPSVGFAAINPFSKDFNWETNVYPEYSLGIDMRIFYVMGLNFATSYQKQVFKQSLGLILNFRVLEFDVNIASSSPTFTKSWGVCGLDVSAGVKMGF